MGSGGEEIPATEIATEYSDITRNWFDDEFVFGTATASYQHEGGANKGGRGLSVWDAFTLGTPDRINDGSNGNVAVDMYTKYKEDIKMMKSMGFDAYRFSISWPRLLPGGKLSYGVNQEGVDFYNDIINTLVENDIAPYVTLFHWDLPNALQLEYGGFLDERVVDDFCDFAELCFWKFGDRVKRWITLNEPWTYAVHGYVRCIFPPSKSDSNSVAFSTISDEFDAKTSINKSSSTKKGNNFVAYRGPCKENDTNEYLSTTSSALNVGSYSWSPKDAYTVARNLILAHAAAVDKYRTKFKGTQKGEIGITLVCHWFEPLDPNDQDDIDAANRALDFMLGWFLKPVLTGEYPESMTDYVDSDNLKPFSGKDKKKLINSIDFLGLNYYTANYASYDPNPTCKDGYFKDQQVLFSTERKGQAIGQPTDLVWLFIVPTGIYDLLTKYIIGNYEKIPSIYITENGMAEKNDIKLPASKACNDKTRINYYRDHLGNLHDAIRDFPKKLDVKGYFAWSYCDNFEWVEGYTVRFGLMYIDYMNYLERYPKESAKWFANTFLVKDGCCK